MTFQVLPRINLLPYLYLCYPFWEHHGFHCTHGNPSLSFPVYADYPPKQSAMIPIPNCVKVPGYFSPGIPGCFVMHFCGGCKKTDIVKLRDVRLQQVVVEGVEECGRDFVQYVIHEVRPVPLESNMTTQQVTPLSNLQPFPL